MIRADNRTNCRAAILVGCVLLCALATGCVHGRMPEIPMDQWDDAPRWPPPPNRSRIVLVGEISSAGDIVERKGFWKSVGDAVAGTDDSVRLHRPIGVAVDSHGRVLVADTGVGAIFIFDTVSGKTRIVSEVPDGLLDSPVAVAVDGDDNIYVSDSSGGLVYVFDDDGDHLRTIGKGELERPTGLAFNQKKDKLYVVDTLAAQIVVFDLRGAKLASIGVRGDLEGELNYPVFVAMDGTGNLWVVDSMNARVQKFSPDGEFIRVIGSRGDSRGDFSRPKGIAIDSDGHIYVVDAMFDNVQVFDGEGRLLTFFGQSGTEQGMFWLPAGMAIDGEDRIFVADTYNSRVQIFRYVKDWDAR